MNLTSLLQHRAWLGTGAALAIVVAIAVAAWALPGGMTTAVAAPAAAAPSPHADAAASAPTREENVAMVEKLAQRLKSQPDDLDGWQMLARAYSIMGRNADAVTAYRRVVALAPNEAQGHADLGRAIGNANGRKLNPEAERSLNKALKLDPGNVMAHALLGKVAMDRGQPKVAKKHFEDALAHMDQEHPFAAQLRSAIQIASAAPANAASATR